MQLYWSLDDVKLNNSWLTIGSFDGVHRGHASIVSNLVSGAHAEGLPAVVLTFYPHPAVVLQKRNPVAYLTTSAEKADLLGALGVDVVITHDFTLELAHTTADDFVAWVHNRLGFSHLCVGYDFALGRGREGNVAYLQKLTERYGYHLQAAEPVTVAGQVVSSSLIRQALADGDMQTAATLLGRNYRLTGEVVHGDGRGRQIGVPTANLATPTERVIPKPGVYACHASLDGQTWNAVTNIGVRPTFENQPATPQIETHLLDCDQGFYGKTISLDFVERLRDEQRFPNVTALVEQIQRDIATGRQRLAETP